MKRSIDILVELYRLYCIRDEIYSICLCLIPYDKPTVIRVCHPHFTIAVRFLSLLLLSTFSKKHKHLTVYVLAYVLTRK